MRTAKDEIVAVLSRAQTPLAIHEISIFAVSENSISARLRELRREGLVAAEMRPGKKFKQWRLVQRLELIG